LQQQQAQQQDQAAVQQQQLLQQQQAQQQQHAAAQQHQALQQQQHVLQQQQVQQHQEQQVIQQQALYQQQVEQQTHQQAVQQQAIQQQQPLQPQHFPAQEMQVSQMPALTHTEQPQLQHGGQSPHHQTSPKSGASWYRVSYVGGVDIRQGPSVSSPKTGLQLRYNETFQVTQEVPGEDGRTYLALADGKGWAFDDTALMPHDPSVVRGHWAPSNPTSPTSSPQGKTSVNWEGAAQMASEWQWDVPQVPTQWESWPDASQWGDSVTVQQDWSASGDYGQWPDNQTAAYAPAWESPAAEHVRFDGRMAEGPPPWEPTVWP